MRIGSPDVSWKLKLTLLLTAVVLTALGSGLTFASHLMAHLYGTGETLSGTNGARTAGTAIFALGALAWIGTRQIGQLQRRPRSSGELDRVLQQGKDSGCVVGSRKFAPPITTVLKSAKSLKSDVVANESLRFEGYVQGPPLHPEKTIELATLPPFSRPDKNMF